jgi:hypothetical protein
MDVLARPSPVEDFPNSAAEHIACSRYIYVPSGVRRIARRDSSWPRCILALEPAVHSSPSERFAQPTGRLLLIFEMRRNNLG